jgi:ribosome maturation factor RimP
MIFLVQGCLSFSPGIGRSIWATRGRSGLFPFQGASLTTILCAKKKRSNGGQRREVEEDEAEEETELIASEEMLSDIEEDGDELGAADYVNDEDEDDDGVVSSIDDIIEDESESVDTGSASGAATAKREQWQKEVSEIITQSIDAQGLNLNKLTFLPARIEIIAVGRPALAPAGEVEAEGGGEVDEDEDYIIPSVEALSSAHRDLYARFELREADLDVVARYEIVVASPGIGQFLRTRRDFESFRGFPVVVNVKEEYKKKKTFEGTLVERDAEDVSISLKGRIVKIPRTLIETVSLPKAKFEVTDTEMKKLR